MERISIIGAGAFGTALANHLSQKNEVKIWSFEPNVVREINKLHNNLTFLPEVELNLNIVATQDLTEALDFSDILINATPVFAIRKTFSNKKLVNKSLVNVSKGIEKISHKLVNEVFAQTLEGDYTYAVLSGPSFASEVARGLDTFVTLACKDIKREAFLKEIFEIGNLKIETSDDIIGVELGGALKNVLAIAAGLASGTGSGKNFQAALFCRGLEEMASLGVKMGAKKDTFYSMAGLGDLFLTSTSDESRNFNFGFRLGQGETLEKAREGKTVEGVGSCESAYYLSNKYELRTIIFKTMYDIIFKEKEPKEAIKVLWKDI